MKKIITVLLSINFINTYSQIEFKKDKLRIEIKKKYTQDSIKFRKTLINSRLNNSEIIKLIQNFAGFAGNIPIYISSTDLRANKSSNVDILNNIYLSKFNEALDGNGIEIMVMDEGRIFDKHKEFGINAQTRIIDKENNELPYSNHATAVGSIIGAIGDKDFSLPYGGKGAIGVLPNVKINSYSFMTTSSGNNYLKLDSSNSNISNHSYIINLGWVYRTTPTTGWYWVANYELNKKDTYSSSYSIHDANYDKLVYKNNYLIVLKGAGNSFGGGPNGTLPNFKWDSATNSYIPFLPSDELPPKNCSNGYNCIGWGSLAKNIITIGATDQLTTNDNRYLNPTSLQRASYSSAGPRKDGAIKPDISAVGSNILFAGYSNDNITDSYYFGSGTSFSTPIVSGIAGALTQINRKLTNNANFNYQADEMKALLIHTANEAGAALGPDIYYGWGFVDAQKASELIYDKHNNKAIFEKNTLKNNILFSKEVIADGTKNLKATISWIDPAAEPFINDIDFQSNTSSRLVNDLDLRIIDTTNNEIFYPWKLDISNPLAPAIKGDNTVDNVEQIEIMNPIPYRKYKIEVRNKNNLIDDENQQTDQNFTLIASGIINNDTTLSSEETLNNEIILDKTVTSDYLKVITIKRNISYTIIDLTGKIIKTEILKNNLIDVKQLPNGTYFLIIKNFEKETVKRFIKK